MNLNYNPDSFQKGKQFEDFVENVLFPDSEYSIEHKTSEFKQNRVRYVGDAQLPDFRFKSKVTGQEFHVEAKFSSSSWQGEYTIASENQVKIFSRIDIDKTPIFVALGYGGQAHEPDFVSLIPFEKYPDGKIPETEVMEYRVEKSTVASSEIHDRIQSLQVIGEVEIALENSTSTEPIDQDSKTKSSQVEETKAPKSSKRNVVVGVLAALIVIVFAIFMFNSDSVSDEELLKERIENYYKILDANKVHEIHNYVSEDLHTWYSYDDPDFETVISDIQRYREKYPFTISEIDWSQFKLTELENGHFKAEYPLEYKIKSKMKSPYKLYNLEITTIWDEDMKLVSAVEVRR
ncbi:hypothetical protein BST97_02425 [Nonlabens spongiae]|uniref:Uncharacterized protein n=1 Tax=Nonlabens spongiae TaxID=331648 RepID=A0A1W6MH77_9FLAO|nr:hypothetical protein [Nonlabens spongiae]ARN76945.1 hypothetical protein BST97_02425 [Nonlabens spongiae]